MHILVPALRVSRSERVNQKKFLISLRHSVFVTYRHLLVYFTLNFFIELLSVVFYVKA